LSLPLEINIAYSKCPYQPTMKGHPSFPEGGYFPGMAQKIIRIIKKAEAQPSSHNKPDKTIKK